VRRTLADSVSKPASPHLGRCAVGKQSPCSLTLLHPLPELWCAGTTADTTLGPALRLVRCARQNLAADHVCKACGAARWDGDDKQLAARVSAILQVNLAHVQIEPLDALCRSAVTCSPVELLRAARGAVMTQCPMSAVQTSDLGRTSLSGVLQRLEVESGSTPGAGLQLARADVKREVDRQLSLSASQRGVTIDWLIPSALHSTVQC
jgi:hypothetical protein